MNVPLKVQIVKPLAAHLLIRFAATGKQAEIPANEFVRKVEEGVFELEEN
ncbi:MAG: hypothetical protein AAB316_09725 [Bacteroidota bacterium]